jgi:zinc and cadmium transporter
MIAIIVEIATNLQFNDKKSYNSPMTPILLSLATFISTLSGGLTGLRNKDRLHRFLGYTAGVLLGVVAFDLLPEIFTLLNQQHRDAVPVMIALVTGFLGFHIIEKSILIHHANESPWQSPLSRMILLTG